MSMSGLRWQVDMEMSVRIRRRLGEGKEVEKKKKVIGRRRNLGEDWEKIGRRRRRMGEGKEVEKKKKEVRIRGHSRS